MIVAAGQRQGEAARPWPGIAVAEDRHEQLAVERLNVAIEVFRESDAAALATLHIGFAAIFRAERDLQVAAGQRGQRPSILIAPSACAGDW